MASYAVHSTRQVANNAASYTPKLQSYHCEMVFDIPVGNTAVTTVIRSDLQRYLPPLCPSTPLPPAQAPHRITPVDEVGSVRSLERTDHHSHQYRIGSGTAEGIYAMRVDRTFFSVTPYVSSQGLRQLVNHFSVSRRFIEDIF